MNFQQVEQVTATITSASPVPGERPVVDFSGTPNSAGHPNSASASINRIRKKSSGKKRLEKSYSTESSLNHLVPNSPVHPSRSAKQRYAVDLNSHYISRCPFLDLQTMENVVTHIGTNIQVVAAAYELQVSCCPTLCGFQRA